MAFTFKKYAALTTALVCAASMTGCADNGYIGTIDGLEIRNGIYLSQLLTAHSNGMSNINEVKAEAGDTSEIADVFSETIDGVNAEQWIKDETLRLSKRYVAIERLFEEEGLTLDAEKVAEVNADVKETWDSESLNYYGFTISVESVYGYPTMGKYYESIGIGQDSMKDIEINALKEEALFLEVYANNEETKVSDEDIDAYLLENYMSVKYIEVPFDDYFGINLTDEAEIKALKDTAKSYVDRYNSGESYIDIYYDHALMLAQNEAMADAEEALEQEGAEQPADFDAYIEEAKKGATAEKAESIEELEYVIAVESNSLSTELSDLITKTDEDGKAYYYETETAAYLIIRDDVTSKTQWKQDNKLNILSKFKYEDFNEYLSAASESYTVEFDSYLVDTKYAPHSYKAFAPAEK